MPALVRQGYPERFSMGLIAGTGSVGLLFPPALPLFIYGTVYGLSASKEMQAIWDTRRFLFAGIVPGMVLVGMLSAVAVTVAIKKRLPRQQFSPGELGKSFALALPELMIPFGVIIGLVVFGFSLPEIAALTVVYTVVLELGVSRLVPGWGKPLVPARAVDAPAARRSRWSARSSSSSSRRPRSPTSWSTPRSRARSSRGPSPTSSRGSCSCSRST